MKKKEQQQQQQKICFSSQFIYLNHGLDAMPLMLLSEISFSKENKFLIAKPSFKLNLPATQPPTLLNPLTDAVI